MCMCLSKEKWKNSKRIDWWNRKERHARHSKQHKFAVVRININCLFKNPPPHPFLPNKLTCPNHIHMHILIHLHLHYKCHARATYLCSNVWKEGEREGNFSSMDDTNTLQLHKTTSNGKFSQTIANKCFLRRNDWLKFYAYWRRKFVRKFSQKYAQQGQTLCTMIKNMIDKAKIMLVERCC